MATLYWEMTICLVLYFGGEPHLFLQITLTDKSYYGKWKKKFTTWPVIMDLKVCPPNPDVMVFRHGVNRRYWGLHELMRVRTNLSFSTVTVCCPSQTRGGQLCYYLSKVVDLPSANPPWQEAPLKQPEQVLWHWPSWQHRRRSTQVFVIRSSDGGSP